MDLAMDIDTFVEEDHSSFQTILANIKVVFCIERTFCIEIDEILVGAYL